MLGCISGHVLCYKVDPLNNNLEPIMQIRRTFGRVRSAQRLSISAALRIASVRPLGICVGVGVGGGGGGSATVRKHGDGRCNVVLLKNRGCSVDK
jgi:hypothetical protein